MASDPQYKPVGGRHSLSKENTQDVELQAKLPQTEDWPQRKAQFLNEHTATVSQRLHDLLERCQLPAKLATALVFVLSITTAFLLLSNIRTRFSFSPPASAHRSLPQMINDTPWDRLMSGLEDGEHVNSEKYPRRFGKDLVILDVDTRPWNNTNPANMSYITWGRTNHYLYSQIHGYDYKFVQAPLPAEDLHYTWVKVPAIREVLKSNYKFIVFIDSDALFPHLKIPLEYLIDYWNITSDIALAVGLAQPDKINFDRFHHKQTDNTGFMVVQNIPAAHDLFKDWDECPTDVKYKDCSHWKKIRLHEQNAYSDYIRYDYADVVRELPCDEVNGWSQHRSINGGHCSGQLVRHQWGDKPHMDQSVAGAIAEVLMPGLVRDLTAKWIDNHTSSLI